MIQIGRWYMINEKVEAFIEKHQLMEKNKTVLVGVSGGPDSMALLHYVNERKQKDALNVIAIGINHQLREVDAERDMLYVKEKCKSWGIPFITKKIDVQAYKQKHKVGTQVASRALRYKAFAEMMLEYDADYLALGHHGDDQIETMLMGLMRMTSIQGLKGIPFKREFANGMIIRPFLSLTKSDIETYCHHHQINPRIDASNFEADYTRNELRLDVVPILKTKNERLHQTIQHLTETIQEDERLLMELAAKEMERIVKTDKNELLATISLKAFRQQPVSLQRRLFRLTLNYLYEKEVPENVSYTHEEIFLSLVNDSTSNKQIDFPNELIIEKSYEKIHCYFKKAQKIAHRYEQIITELDDKVELPNGDVLSISQVQAITSEKDDKYTFIYPVAEVMFPLQIRHRKSGDKMSYKGLNGRKKLKDIFIDEKTPRHERDEKFLLVDNTGEILWLIGLRKKAVNITNNKPYLVIKYIKNNN